MCVAHTPHVVAVSRVARLQLLHAFARRVVNDARRELVMTNLITRFRALLHDDEGQDLIEYALLAGLVALVSTVALTEAGTEVRGIWEDIRDALIAVPEAPAAGA
jgi:pilus assembly protein Flp/PilA